MIRSDCVRMFKFKMAITPMDINRNKEMEKGAPVVQIKSPKQYTESFLYDALKPLIVTMKCFGLYNSWQTKSRFRLLTLLYTIVPGAIVFSTFARGCISFRYVKGFDLALFGTLNNVIWMFWCCGGYVFCLLAWLLESRAANFFRSFDKVLGSCELLHNCYMRLLRRRAWIVTGLGASFVALNTIYPAYLMVGSDTVGSTYNPVEVYMTFPEWAKIVTKTVLVINQVYISATWVLPSVFAHCIAYALRLELCAFNFALKEDIADDGRFRGQLHKYRSRFQVVTKLIDTANTLLQCFISINMFCALGLLIFLLYSALWDPHISNSFETLFPYVYWIAMACLFCGLVLYDGAQINSAAHESFSLLHDIRLDSLDTRDMNELTVFLNKVSGPPIGLTALGLFVIDKPTILTTVGMFLTYFVIVVQFRMPTSTETNSTATT